jgi:hypothetical protein
VLQGAFPATALEQLKTFFAIQLPQILLVQKDALTLQYDVEGECCIESKTA